MFTKNPIPTFRSQPFGGWELHLTKKLKNILQPKKFMSNSVHIPDSIKEIKKAIARRITILAEWQTRLAKTRKNSLRSMRAGQVAHAQKQIAELRQALKVAQTKAEIEKAQAFVKSLAGVRKDWENGLFDWKKVEKKPWHKPTFKIEL